MPIEVSVKVHANSDSITMKTHHLPSSFHFRSPGSFHQIPTRPSGRTSGPSYFSQLQQDAEFPGHPSSGPVINMTINTSLQSAPWWRANGFDLSPTNLHKERKTRDTAGDPT